MQWMLLVFLAGCAAPPPRWQDGAYKTPAELFSERWTGRHEDDVIVTFGRPMESFLLSGGTRVDSYRWERGVASSSSRMMAFNSSAGGSSGSLSTTVFCERRFEIDPKTMLVLRAVIAGGDCDYSR